MIYLNLNIKIFDIKTKSIVKERPRDEKSSGFVEIRGTRQVELLYYILNRNSLSISECHEAIASRWGTKLRLANPEAYILVFPDKIESWTSPYKW